MTKEISLEINKLCNFRCTFCYTEKYREDLPSINEVLAVIQQGIESGVSSISLTGGEPLLQWERVKAIAEFAKNHGLRTRLNTNGMLLVPGSKTLDLVSLFDEFQISCNAASDKDFSEYARIKQTPPPLSALLVNINHLLDAGAAVTIRFTLDARTAPSLVPVFLLFCGEHEALGYRAIKRFKVRVSVPAGAAERAGSSMGRIKDAAAQFFDVLKSYSDVDVLFKDGSRAVAVPQNITNLSSPPCICGERSIHISSDLKMVTPCVFLRDLPEFSLGNLRDGTSRLSDVWNGVGRSRFGMVASERSTCASHELWTSNVSGGLDGRQPIAVETQG